MKMKKSKKMNLPEVHILGDLEDVKNLVSGIGKKKTLVIFADAEQESFYVETKGKIKQINPKGVKRLEKSFKLIYFSYFPSKKKIQPAKGEVPPEQAAEEGNNTEMAEKKEKKNPESKKIKTEKKAKKVKEEKKKK
jgi:hypothetical protein